MGSAAPEPDGSEPLTSSGFRDSYTERLDEELRILCESIDQAAWSDWGGG